MTAVALCTWLWPRRGSTSFRKQQAARKPVHHCTQSAGGGALTALSSIHSLFKHRAALDLPRVMARCAVEAAKPLARAVAWSMAWWTCKFRYFQGRGRRHWGGDVSKVKLKRVYCMRLSSIEHFRPLLYSHYFFLRPPLEPDEPPLPVELGTAAASTFR